MFGTRTLGLKILLSLGFAQAAALDAQMSLPFRDNAVLQQKTALPVWGETLPGAAVTVTFGGQAKQTAADADGRWRVILDPLDAVPLKTVTETPVGRTMTVRCEKDGRRASKEINNLVVGDVWLCAGQSNMAGTIRKAILPKNYPPNSILEADYPSLRCLSPSKDTWLVCSPETAVEFSRVAFYFARRLQGETLIPTGIMVTAVGGSNIESWLNQPPYPTGGNYEELVKPLVGFGIRGAVWYQGESNEADGLAYRPKLESLILGWRKAWAQGDFPVHFVQLPGLGKSSPDDPAGGDGRAKIRQAFADALSIENTGMAVTIDVGTAGEHPPNKFDTGVRLARSVLKSVYGHGTITSCPLYRSHKIEGNTIRVSFTDDADKGLMIARKAEPLPEAFLPPVPAPDGKLQWLSIRDQHGKWHWADGRVEGSELIVSAPGVEKPDAVRYAYTAQPLGNLLYNTDGMPVGPFRTDGG